MAKKPYSIAAYESAQRTTPPLQAVVLLYDGVLRRLRGARAAAQAGDTVRQIENTMQAARILDGLDRSLDMAQGGEVAQGLRDTYWAIAGTLFRAIGKPGTDGAYEKLIEAMSVLRDAWAEIAGVPLLDGRVEERQIDAGAR